MLEKNIPAFLDLLYTDETHDMVSLDEVRDAFHTNQILSKQQAIAGFHSLPNTPSKVLYIGSWFGFLTRYLCEQYPYTVFDEMDIDPRCRHIGGRFNANTPNYGNHYTQDANTFARYSEYDTIINLSSEHMPMDWFSSIPSGTQLVVQSNNLVIPDHINLCGSLNDLIRKFPLREISHQHDLTLNVLNRYTIAGVK